MKKALLLTTLAASMAFATATAQVQLKQASSPLQQLQTVELQQAQAVERAVKGENATVTKFEPLFGLKPGESKTFQLGKKKHGLRAAELTDGFKVYGTLMLNNDWPTETYTDPATGESFKYQRSLYDVYTFDGEKFTATGYDQDDELSRYLVATGGGALVDGVYYFNYNQEFMGQLSANGFFAYDLANGTLKGYGLDDTFSDIAQQTAYDPTTGEIYGQFWNAKKTGYVWGTRNKNTGRTDAVSVMYGSALRALAFDHLGRPWAINMQNELICIDKLTGQYDVIGKVELPLSNVIMTGAIDPKTDVFYFFGATQGKTEQEYLSHLYTIDLTTAEATLVKDLPGNALMAGAAFAPVVYTSAVPADAKDLVLTFDKDNLSGTFSCTAPTMTVGGESLASSNVTITLDGVEIKSMENVAAGQNITLDITVEKSGVHVVQVVATTAAGEGKPATIHKYVGLDTPDVVTNVKLTKIDNNHATLSWDAPTKGIHNGYVNPDEVHYIVTNSDREYESEDLATTSISVGKEGTKLSVRTYGILPFNAAGRGELVGSDRIYYGDPAEAPATWQFITQDNFNMWKVVDENGDGKTWSFDVYGQSAKTEYNRDIEAEDWLFSPPIHLTPDSYYDLVTRMNCRMAYYQEKFAIYLAKTQDVSGVDMKNPIRDITLTDLDKSGGMDSKPAYYSFTDPFCVEEEGDYYLAYFYCSDANMLGIELTSVQVKSGSSKLAPAAVTDLQLTAGERGKLEVTATFTAPSTNTKGEAINDLTRAVLKKGDDIVASLRDLVPGQQCSMTTTATGKDNLITQGVNKLALYVYNDEGIGLPANGQVYVGVDTPDVVQNADVINDGNQVFVTWEAPAGGKSGGYVDVDNLTYAVATQGDNGNDDPTDDILPVYQGSDTSCEDASYANAGPQYDQYYGIWAKNVAGESVGVATPIIISGGAYQTPFKEDFSGNTEPHFWLLGYYENSTAKATITDKHTHDEGGYSFAVEASRSTGGMHNLSSGKIKLNGNCKLTFATKATVSDSKIGVSIAEDWVIKHAKQLQEFTSTKDEWTVYEYDLSAYAGKTVVFDFTFQLGGRGTVYFDDIQIADPDGINTIEAEAAATNWYDLSGRRTKATNGIRVSNGKKVVK